MTERLQKAIDFMKAAHRSIGQTRKDGVRPYEVHPLDVMARLQNAGVTDEDVLIAALLHDVLEDVTPKNPAYDLCDIVFEFGMRVGAMVGDLTDEFIKVKYPDLNRKTRKQLERERYSTFSDEVKQIKLADIASNLHDDGEVLENGLPEVGFNRMFIKEKELCLPYLAPNLCLDPFPMAHCQLYATARDILAEQKKKFDVR